MTACACVRRWHPSLPACLPASCRMACLSWSGSCSPLLPSPTCVPPVGALTCRDECGLERACQLSERLLRAPGAGGDLYRCALRIEREAAQQEEAGVAGPSSSSAAAPQQRQRRRQRVSALYDAAVAAYGATESDLWLGFAQWAAACGQGVGQVYWRASKELGDPTHLVEAFRDQQLAPE